jgi:hypothetical protein
LEQKDLSSRSCSCVSHFSSSAGHHDRQFLREFKIFLDYLAKTGNI